MTKIICYACNHCHQDLRPEHGHGIRFTGNSSAHVVAIKDAETHLCPDCAKGYAEALTAIYPPA